MDFHDWLDGASRRLVYHRGFLSRDWEPISDEAHILAALAASVRRAADKGLVVLFQRRVGEGVYEYSAHKLTSPIAKKALAKDKRTGALSKAA
ncbi:MAG TPA: hypothetical protein VGJ20_34780 [Xanthobacteraceae bacterium]